MRNSTLGFIGSAVVALAGVATVQAQYVSGFEAPTYAGSASGTVLTGQDGYYIPAGTTSVDQLVYTYAGNTLGIPTNPNGGSQFVAGTGPGGSTFCRGQRDLAWGTGSWTYSYDILVKYVGTLPSAQNVGSNSSQPLPGGQVFIALNTWTDPLTAATWDADYIKYDPANNQQQVKVPDTGFQNLAVDHWYRRSTTMDFATNRITSVSITDLTTNTTVTYAPADWYLEGGAAGGRPTPTGHRLFAGGSTAGNTVAWDNVSIAPTVTGPTLDVTGACPGRIDLAGAGFTAGGNVAIIFASNTGGVTIPSGNPCAGTQLGLGTGNIQLVNTVRASATGTVATGGNAPAGACGGFLQLLDLSTCDTSNTDQIP